MNKILFAAAAGLALTLAACSASDQGPTNVQAQQATKAAEAAQSLQFEKNAEIDNIKARLKLTANPGQIGYVLLLNQAGQPIVYTSVKGKITSGGKRLTQPTVNRCLQYEGSTSCSWQVVQGPSDEGTYGTSGEYIYFWSVDGQYYQWAGNYLYSDKPFRTNIQPLVIQVSSK